MVDLLLTDPPYNVDYKGHTKDQLTIQNDKMKETDFKEFLTKAFSNACEVMKKGASFYVWHASRSYVHFVEALETAGLPIRQQLIWNKNNFILGRQDYHWKHEPCLYGWKLGASHNWYSDRKQSTVLDFKKPLRNGLHPTMKPIDLFEYLIGNSTKEGDTVLDMFGGSGTTLLACERMNRRCLMMELDPKYCEVIIQRWEEETGRKAVEI